ASLHSAPAREKPCAPPARSWLHRLDVDEDLLAVDAYRERAQLHVVGVEPASGAGVVTPVVRAAGEDAAVEPAGRELDLLVDTAIFVGEDLVLDGDEHHGAPADLDAD